MKIQTVRRALLWLVAFMALIAVLSACGPIGNNDYYEEDDWVTVTYYLHDKKSDPQRIYVDPTEPTRSME